jgi:tRNA 2-thiouridine synthesizing protein B
MGALHLVSRSPHESLALAHCLARAGKGDALLLLEGGVYAALEGSACAPRLREAMGGVAVYALEADLAARGIAAEEVAGGVVRVDYEGFVELCLRHSPVQSWF